MSEKWTGDWSLEKPPVEGAVLTERGWEIPLKGTDPADGIMEVIVAIGQAEPPVAAAEANIMSVAFEEVELEQGDAIVVLVTYNENVDVTAGATLEVSSTGGSGDFSLTAAEQLSENIIRFEGVVPSEAADLSIATQTIVGTIADSVDAVASELVIAAEVIEAQLIEIV